MTKASTLRMSQVWYPGLTRVVVDFAVEPYGVGPVMGLDSDDFFLQHQMRTSAATKSTDPLERALVR
jgi:hypothetical protein